MVDQIPLPYPLEKMFEHLDLDIEWSFELLPTLMRDAVVDCQNCRMFQACDYDVESRYFLCPNRNLLDQLEQLQGKA
jgi:hypothetical protein